MMMKKITVRQFCLLFLFPFHAEETIIHHTLMSRKFRKQCLTQHFHGMRKILSQNSCFKIPLGLLNSLLRVFSKTNTALPKQTQLAERRPLPPVNVAVFADRSVSGC